jgi:hypothetical protein
VKKHFLIIDTETTQTDKVADIGIVVCDKAGKIAYEGGFLVKEFFNNPEQHPLFHVFGDANDVFSKASLPARYERYSAMLNNGTRMAASVPAVNNLLAKILARYNPTLTAYNLAFDFGKCRNSDIDLSIFGDNKFCLWHAAAAKWGHTKAYRNFVLEHLYFGQKTKNGHLGYQTKADCMAKFLIADPDLPDEPHTALEDARDYERPILAALVKNTPPKVYMNAPAYSWRDYAVKDHFTAR